MSEVPYEPPAPAVPTSEKAQLRQIGAYLKTLGDAEIFAGVVAFCRFYQRTVLSTSGGNLYAFINGRPRFTFEIDGAREGLPAAMAKP